MPAARELDMLLTAGERISMALLAMAIHDLGVEARSLHRLAGRPHHRLGARQGADHRRHARAASARRSTRARSPIVAGFQGVDPGHQGHHHARSRRLGHHRRRAGRGARAPTSARSTPTSTACSPPTRASCPRPARSPRITYEEMLELAAPGAKVLHLRCVEYARRYDLPIHVRSSFSTEGTGHVRGPDIDPHCRRRRSGAADHRRRRARPQRGQGHRRRRARPAGRGRARSSAPSPTPSVNIDMIVQNVSAQRPASPTSPSPARRPTAQKAHRRARRGARPRSASRTLRYDDDDRQGLARRRRHALAPGRLGDVLRRARPTPASTSR